jgi:hypothetical protein
MATEESVTTDLQGPLADVQQQDTDAADLGPVSAWIDKPAFRESRFFAEMLNRLVTGRDANIVITAASETGVGKTTLAVAIALMLDQHGWTADKAAVASAAQYDHQYDECAPGSVLILDEAEKAADARRGMTNESVSLSQSFATKRYRQVFSILTAPSKSWIDKRLGSDAADYWIQAQGTDMGRIKGEAAVYRLKTNEHYQTDYTKRTEYIHWPNLDGNEEFKKLDKRKRELLESDQEQSFVDADDVQNLKESAADAAADRQKRELVKRMNKHEALTQHDIAEIVDMSSGWVNDVVNDE